MNITRREMLATVSSLPLASMAVNAAEEVPDSIELPFKSGFVDTDITYLDSGSSHPISLGAYASLQAYLGSRMLDPDASEYRRGDREVLENYAKLVNADVDEVTYVQSTTTGEQMVLRALGLPDAGGHVVTDTLHFFGSLPLYAEMERQGVEVTWIRDRDGRILLDDVRKAVRPGTKLVALSLISTINGFEHDLKAVCDIAHEAGALVYADIIHAAGCVPVDLHASGVDFAAGSSYKWLMGDFGLGFLYVRKEVQSQLKRTNYGYFGMSEFRSHIYPFDPPGDSIVDYAFRDDATGLFALGTRASSVIALLQYSLDYILKVDVRKIQVHAQTLIERLHEELPKRGFSVTTPRESGAPMIACAYEDARQTLAPRLREAKVKITVSRNRFRISVSVFNDMNDIERLVRVLGRA